MESDYRVRFLAAFGGLILGTFVLFSLSSKQGQRDTGINKKHLQAMKMKGDDKGLPNPQTGRTILKYELVDSSTTMSRYAAFELAQDGSYQPVSINRWATLLSTEGGSGEYDLSANSIIQFNEILSSNSSKMKAFFWETKGTTWKNSFHKQFEFVLIEDSYLYSFADKNQDPATFGRVCCNERGF